MSTTETPYVVNLLFPPHLTRKRRLGEEDYRDKANRFLDDRMHNDQSEVVESSLLEHGFAKTWMRLHKIVHRLRSLHKGFVSRLVTIEAQMQLFQDSTIRDIDSRLSFTSDFDQVCRKYFEKNKVSLKTVHKNKLYELSAPVYDDFFVPLCTMLFMHLQTLIDGEFIQSKEARKMVLVCLNGLMQKPRGLANSNQWERLQTQVQQDAVPIKKDIIPLPIPASREVFARKCHNWPQFYGYLHNFLYLGTPGKFVNGQRYRVGRWALSQYIQMKMDMWRQQHDSRAPRPARRGTAGINYAEPE